MDDLDDLLDDIQPVKKPNVKGKAAVSKNDNWGDANTVTSNKQNTEDQFFEGGEDDEDPWSGLTSNNNQKK